MGRSWPGPLSLGPLVFTSFTRRHSTVERLAAENNSGHIIKTLGRCLTGEAPGLSDAFFMEVTRGKGLVGPS